MASSGVQSERLNSHVHGRICNQSLCLSLQARFEAMQKSVDVKLARLGCV